MHLVPLRVSKLWFLVEVESVEQILGQRAWMPVPAAPSSWPGVMAFRGRAVAVLDLGLLTQAAPRLREGEQRRRTVLLHAAGCSFAVPVDEVREVQAVDSTAARAAHVTAHRFCHTEVELEGTVMPLLDLQQLVSEVLGGAPAP